MLYNKAKEVACGWCLSRSDHAKRAQNSWDVSGGTLLVICLLWGSCAKFFDILGPTFYICSVISYLHNLKIRIATCVQTCLMSYLNGRIWILKKKFEEMNLNDSIFDEFQIHRNHSKNNLKWDLKDLKYFIAWRVIQTSLINLLLSNLDQMSF